MNESTDLFTDKERTLLRKFYDIEKSMKRCGQAEEYIECHCPFYTDLWGRFKTEAVKGYFERRCETFEECFEILLWPREWVHHEKPKTQNVLPKRMNPEFQNLLSRLFKGTNVQVLE